MDFSPSPYIADTKRHLRRLSDQSLAFAEVRGAIRAEVDALQGEIARGGSGVPELRYSDVESNSVSPELLASIRRKGCAIIRGVFARAQADAWNREIGDYIEANDYFTKARAKAGLDKYFSQLKDAVPQIFGIYWSKPQVMARQAPQMAITKRFLNRLWDVRGPAGDEFDPDQDFSYADRTRRRQPGDTTLGLSPHMDAGSYERWVDPAFQAIYAPVFNGRWRDYDPWKATYRTQTREFSSPAVASMFRTFQGWTGLTEQGPNGGTLQLMPSTLAIAYVLLRALQDDVAEDDLCGAAPGRALGTNLAQHPDLLAGLITIPVVYPGDTVWWHPDIIHAVEKANTSQNWANVIYIGASPRCGKNAAYVGKQAQAFLQGRSAPDFAPEDYEVDFTGRATPDDLTPLGRAQMGL